MSASNVRALGATGRRSGAARAGAADGEEVLVRRGIELAVDDRPGELAHAGRGAGRGDRVGRGEGGDDERGDGDDRAGEQEAEM